MRRVWLWWSSGKDSAFTLHVLRQRDDVEVTALVTTVNEHFDRVAMHAVRRELLEDQARGCLRCLLLVMCTHPFAKKALTLHLSRSEGHERYFGCNLMHRKALASSHQHLMAEAPKIVS